MKWVVPLYSNIDEIKATYVHGILKITIPKKKLTWPRIIEVTMGRDSSPILIRIEDQYKTRGHSLKKTLKVVKQSRSIRVIMEGHSSSILVGIHVEQYITRRHSSYYVSNSI